MQANFDQSLDTCYKFTIFSELSFNDQPISSSFYRTFNPDKFDGELRTAL